MGIWKKVRILLLDDGPEDRHFGRVDGVVPCSLGIKLFFPRVGYLKKSSYLVYVIIKLNVMISKLVLVLVVWFGFKIKDYFSGKVG